MKALHYLVLLLMMTTCVSTNKSLIESRARKRLDSLDYESQNNIHTLINMIEEQSLVKDAGAKHYIPYEFRIPLGSVKKNEVFRIDPSVQFIKRSDSYQCIGENATKEKIFQIIALPYTYKIRFCPYE